MSLLSTRWAQRWTYPRWGCKCTVCTRVVSLLHRHAGEFVGQTNIHPRLPDVGDPRPCITERDADEPR